MDLNLFGDWHESATPSIDVHFEARFKPTNVPLWYSQFRLKRALSRGGAFCIDPVGLI